MITKNIVLTSSWCLAAFCPALAAAEFQGKPNIILILADDLGYETIGAYGGASYHTPRIDQLASEGCASIIVTRSRFARRAASNS